MKDETKTVIQVDKETAKKLQEIKLTKRESYDEVIIRLLKYDRLSKETRSN